MGLIVRRALLGKKKRRSAQPSRIVTRERGKGKKGECRDALTPNLLVPPRKRGTPRKEEGERL